MKTIITFLLIFFIQLTAVAQDSIKRIIKIDELFSLAETNSKQLAASKDETQISSEETAVLELSRFPQINLSANAGYLSNAVALNPDFSFNQNIALPHFSNNYSFSANQVLYNGSAVTNKIRKSKLKEQLSQYNFDQDKNKIKVFILGKYLELYALYNQQEVYKTNITLAKRRLKNINDLHKEGMVTRNDIIRSELEITKLELLSSNVDNDITINNSDLCIILGLESTTKILIDPSIIQFTKNQDQYSFYLAKAFKESPVIHSADVLEKMAYKNVQIARAEQFPVLELYATNGMVRPFRNVVPAIDNYVNNYQVGVSLSYDISSLYRADNSIRLSKTKLAQQQKKKEYAQQQVEMEVSSAFKNFQQAQNQYSSLEKSVLLADDNYRIVENKYLNQLALLTDILDASTAKLTAELDHSNAGAKIVYQWYKLQKATGNL